MAINGGILGGRYLLGVRTARDPVGAWFVGSDKKHDGPVTVRLLELQPSPEDAVLGRAVKLAAGLQAPTVASPVGGGRDGPDAYVVHRPFEGESVAQRLARLGTPKLDMAIWIAAAVASALEKAHAQGVAHQALSTHSVWLTRHGARMRVKVADFCLPLEDSAEHLLPEFLAPEYGQSSPLEDPTPSPAADLYSLGVVMYMLLTGKTPVRGDDPKAIREQVRRAPIPGFPKGAPDRVVELMRGLLSGAPGARPAAAEVRIALEAHLTRVNWPGEPRADLPKPGEGVDAAVEDMAMSVDFGAESVGDVVELDAPRAVVQDGDAAHRRREELNERRRIANDEREAQVLRDEARVRSRRLTAFAAAAIVVLALGGLVLASGGDVVQLAADVAERIGLESGDAPATAEVAPIAPAASPAPAPASAPTWRPAPAEDPVVRQSLTLVRVEPATISRGTDEGAVEESPQHRVRVTAPFAIGQTEVTRAQWRARVDVDPSSTKDCEDDCGVEGITWWEALAFCNQLSREALVPECYTMEGCEGALGEGMKCESVRWLGPAACFGFRLPTEAEWEVAAQGATADTAASPRRAGAGPAVHGVRGFLGHVREWVWDVHDADWYGRTPPEDPLGPRRGDERGIRGCAWDDDPGACRIGARLRAPPTQTSARVGFRVARTIAPEP